ncbi:MAG: hypothetical protein ISS28_04900 [Candidatus Cloacimonetes bacterium]|nr:hypothetical protein [Actinomycetota bacterium]MBL7086418.1 hypothetical protein [Candidatus Cloacimonadota bacterium]
MGDFKSANILFFFIFFSIPLFLYPQSICSEDFPETKNELFNIFSLNYNDLPYTYYKEDNFDTNYLSDRAGVILFEWDSKEYYHPVNMVGKALGYLDLYVQKQNQNYLNKANIYASKFIEIADTINGAMYFPYEFDFPLHDDSLDVIHKPWYSAMAQGKILTFFTRLYKITKDLQYFITSKMIYSSFKQVKDTSNVWIAMVDSNGFYWLELYPTDTPTHVLNGFMFSLIGLYDYFLLTSDPECRCILQSALTTLKHNALLYRRPGKASYYCLKHKHVSKKYHIITVSYLFEMYKITGDYFFYDLHVLFKNDYSDG